MAYFAFGPPARCLSELVGSALKADRGAGCTVRALHAGTVDDNTATRCCGGGGGAL